MEQHAGLRYQSIFDLVAIFYGINKSVCDNVKLSLFSIPTSVETFGGNVDFREEIQSVSMTTRLI